MKLFFFNDTATTEIYTLSLHDALPIFSSVMEKANVSFIIRDFTEEGLKSKEALLENITQQVMENYPDRKSTRLNSSHANISYAVFCLKKKNLTFILASSNDSTHMLRTL